MILSCLLNIMVYAIPIVFIQSFLGQFSSSGFISVFRIAPLFKGLGYVGLFLNLTSLSFYSAFAAVPLLYLFHSFRTVLPWSCEGFEHWMDPNETDITSSYCNFNHSEHENGTYLLLQIPSVEFFVYEVQQTFSFPLFGCVLAVWAAIAMYTYNSTELIGKFFRYSVIILITLLVIVFTRMVFMPGVREGLAMEFEKPLVRGTWHVWLFAAPMLSFATFGPGWGSVLSMASYNKFKTNISKYSWVICFSQVILISMIGLVCMFTEYHLTQNMRNIIVSVFELQWTSFLTIPTSLATLAWPHLWTWMFLGILLIGSFNLVAVQMFSVLTALFDEFEQLRPHRKEVIFGLSGLLAIFSSCFCFEDALLFIEILSSICVTSQTIINFIVLMVVLWVYGRERFQRDVEFMTSQLYATWKVYIVRFVTPPYLLGTVLFTIAVAIFNHSYVSHLTSVAVVVAALPWLALPAFCIYRLMQTNGTIVLRFKRCTKPTEWYPVDPEYRQRYDETVDNPETAHPLTTIVL